MAVDEHSEGLSRGDALRQGVLATGALLSVGAAGPWVRQALALAGESDADTLNLLLKFEYLEINFYETGLNRLYASSKLKALMRELLGQERQHAQAVTEQIRKVGGKPIPERDYGSFAYRHKYVQTFLKLGKELETNVVGAFNGAIPLLESPAAQKVAASIVQVDARHSAALAIEAKEEPAPEAFDPARTEYEALNSVIRFTGPIESPSG